MKYNLIYVLLFALFLSGNIFAQQTQHNIRITGAKAWQSGNSLNVEIEVDGSNSSLASQESSVLSPVILSNEREKELQPFVISGNKRHKANLRGQAFNTGYLVAEPPYVSVKKNESSGIRYVQSVPFESWMQTARLELKESICGCKNCGENENRVFLTNLELDNIKKPEVNFIVSYITPDAEPVKNRFETGEAYLDFPVGKSIILTDFRDNFREISKIQDAINQLISNKDASVTSIKLEGFASPEASYNTNSLLSSRRSQALKTYLQGRYDYPDNLFIVSSVAEDWDGLKKLIEESDIQGKTDILDIINSSSAEDDKENSLKALPIYGTLLKDYFPKLRRVEYKLNYTVRAFSVEEGKEIIKTRPGQMSLNEMFLVANTYSKGSKEFNEIFETAARLFPNNVVAKLNAAAAALERRDIVTANRYLSSLKDTSASWNNQGVLAALQDDLANASQYFIRAKANGSTEASENLERLKVLEEYQKKMQQRGTFLQ